VHGGVSTPGGSGCCCSGNDRAVGAFAVGRRMKFDFRGILLASTLFAPHLVASLEMFDGAECKRKEWTFHGAKGIQWPTKEAEEG
jgi:hypothetical protein